LVVKCALVAIALQILAGGFAAGAVYGLVAVGHSLVFRLTGVVHFAFGELIALGVFVTLFVAAGAGPVSQTSVGGGRFLLALVVGLVVTAAASVGAYFLAIEPYRARGSVIGWVGASLAVAFTIRTLLVVFFDRPAYVFPDPFRRLGDDGVWHLGGDDRRARCSLQLPRWCWRCSACSCGARASAARWGDRTGLRRSGHGRLAGVSARRPGLRSGGVWASLAPSSRTIGRVRRGRGCSLRPLRARRGRRRVVRRTPGPPGGDHARARASDGRLGPLGRRPPLRDDHPAVLGLAALAWRFRAGGIRMSTLAAFGDGLRDATALDAPRRLRRRRFGCSVRAARHGDAPG
jgi:hypothetical protein